MLLQNDTSFYESKPNAKSMYLSNCDLINKYQIQSVYNLPKLEKIVLTFSFEESLKSFEKKKSSLTKEDIQTQSFLLLYLLTNFVSYIDIKKSKNVDDFVKESQLRLVFNTDFQKQSLLKIIFIESWRKLKLLNNSAFSYSDFNKILLNKPNLKDHFRYSVNLPVSMFIELEEFFNKSNQTSKDVFINLQFCFLNFNKQISIKSSEKLIKNLPFFWISG